nr:hypothetical protein [Tanacetum cinerariifolium]
LTADGLAAVTLGEEMLGLEDGCWVKGLLRGDLDLETTSEAMLGRALEKYGLTALSGLTTVVFLILLVPFEWGFDLTGTGGEMRIGACNRGLGCLGDLTSSGD